MYWERGPRYVNKIASVSGWIPDLSHFHFLASVPTQFEKVRSLLRVKFKHKLTSPYPHLFITPPLASSFLSV
jgi:hypothetical protein